MADWQIEFYRTARGDSPVEDFIDSLQPKDALKVVGIIELLETVGPRMSMPHASRLRGTELWGLRTRGRNHQRILYAAVTNERFLLLHGFSKKTQKTPAREIHTAESRLRDWRERKGR